MQVTAIFTESVAVSLGKPVISRVSSPSIRTVSIAKLLPIFPLLTASALEIPGMVPSSGKFPLGIGTSPRYLQTSSLLILTFTASAAPTWSTNFDEQILCIAFSASRTPKDVAYVLRRKSSASSSMAIDTPLAA